MRLSNWNRLPHAENNDLLKALNHWFREYQTLNKVVDIPSFRVHRNGVDQTAIATGTLTRIQFTTATLDTHTYWNSSTYRYTPKVPGVYYFQLTGRFVTWVADSFCTVAIYLNGSAVDAFRSTSHTTTAPSCQVSAVLQMNGSTDYVEFYTQQDTGGSADLYGGIPNTYAHGFKVADHG